MCLDKKEIKELLEAVAKVKQDTGNIRQTQEALGKTVGDMGEHLKNLNSRTQKVENKVSNLEDDEYRKVRCVQKEVISRIEKNMLTVDKFEAWERKKQQEKEKEEREKQKKLETVLIQEKIAASQAEARQRRNGWITTAIVGAGTIAMALIGILT